MDKDRILIGSVNVVMPMKPDETQEDAEERLWRLIDNLHCDGIERFEIQYSEVW